ncbi:MAG: twin-arginine translocase TatA/TatE family subunit [Gaiellaceae bacterium]
MTSGILSPWHLAIFLLVVLLVFGPKRLPEMGRSLGKGMREFKDSISGVDPRTPDPIEAPAAAPSEPAAVVHSHPHDAA